MSADIASIKKRNRGTHWGGVGGLEKEGKKGIAGIGVLLWRLRSTWIIVGTLYMKEGRTHKEGWGGEGRLGGGIKR